MDLHGLQLLGRSTSRQGTEELHGVDPRSGERLEPTFADATAAEVDRALILAATAVDPLAAAGREARAAWSTE